MFTCTPFNQCLPVLLITYSTLTMIPHYTQYVDHDPECCTRPLCRLCTIPRTMYAIHHPPLVFLFPHPPLVLHFPLYITTDIIITGIVVGVVSYGHTAVVHWCGGGAQGTATL